MDSVGWIPDAVMQSALDRRWMNTVLHFVVFGCFYFFFFSGGGGGDEGDEEEEEEEEEEGEEEERDERSRRLI